MTIFGKLFTFGFFLLEPVEIDWVALWHVIVMAYA